MSLEKEAAKDLHKEAPKDLQREAKDLSPGEKAQDRQYRERDSQGAARGRRLTEDVDIASQLGFSSFGSTKNKKVAGNNQSSAKKNKKAKFRQYMNREKGFNRSLSPQRK